MNIDSFLHPQSDRARRMVAGAAILLVASLACVTIFATGPSAKPEPRHEKAWRVSAVTIEPAPLAPMFRAYGRVESRAVAALSVNVAADIRAVHVREGQWVETGELLLELDDRELALRVAERRAELRAAEATLKSIESEHAMVTATTEHFAAMHRISNAKLERHEELYAERMISQAVLDEAIQQASQQTINYQGHMQMLGNFPHRIGEQRARISKAQATLSQASLDLSRAQLTAPFAGPVISVDAAPGARTQSGRPLVTLADTARVEIRAQVPDAYSKRFRSYLNLGTVVLARTELAGRPVSLPLTRLAGNVRDGQSGLDAFFEVPAELAPALGRLADLMVVLPPEPAVVALPVQAIFEGDRVYRVDDQRLQAVRIERIGDFESAAGQFQILVRSPDLAAGAQVITTQLPRAISGLLVEVI